MKISASGRDVRDVHWLKLTLSIEEGCENNLALLFLPESRWRRLWSFPRPDIAIGWLKSSRRGPGSWSLLPHKVGTSDPHSVLTHGSGAHCDACFSFLALLVGW